MAPSTTRTDTVEEVGFASGDDPLFVAMHLPARPAGAVVVCGSIGWELAKNYRREVLLGRALAACGLAVARFHYRGLGDSGGAPEDITLASMTADAHRACALLRARTGCRAPAVVGVRTGALVAAALADRAAPVVLWDPVVDGRDYVRELVQIRRVWSMTRGGADAEALVDFDPDGSLDLLGYRLPRGLLNDLRGAELGRWLCLRQGEVLSLHLGVVPRRLREILPGAPRVRAEALPHRIDWWLKRRAFEPEETAPLTTALVSATVQWLAERAAETGSPPPGTHPSPGLAAAAAFTSGVPPGGGSPPAVRREVVWVPAGGDRLAGVLVRPSGEPADIGAVILNCGSYHLVGGPAGLWAVLADKLAGLGVASLRVAYPGVADSTGMVTDFDLTQPRTAELDAARAALDRAGPRRHVLVGGCLGARTACAANLAGVVGLGLVSLPMHAESLASGVDSRRTHPVPTAAGSPLPWLNHTLLPDLRRCVAARLPIRLVYCRDEPYYRDFLAARSGALGEMVRPARDRFTVRLADGPDSMFATAAVSDAVVEFVAELLGSRG